MKNTILTSACSILPSKFIQIALGREKFLSFAIISDSHIQQIRQNEFVQNFDNGLKKAVAECNLLYPQPDFVIYNGDLAAMGRKDELLHGAKILSRLKYKTYFVIGEADYYLDLGQEWEKLFGPTYHSFNHKGVHFIILNSILTWESWIHKNWSAPEERVRQITLLDHPANPPFMIGIKQLNWLKQDLASVSNNTPIIIFSHSPLQKIFRKWNFWTEDIVAIYKTLQRFKQVMVFYGHVHQIQYNQIGNIAFYSSLATSYPLPYPNSVPFQKNFLSHSVVSNNRSDPAFERDGTGWQTVFDPLENLLVDYSLAENPGRILTFNKKNNRPEDSWLQDKKNRNASSDHF